MSSQRSTGSPEYETMELLLAIVRRATWYRLSRARDSRYTLRYPLRGVPFCRDCIEHSNPTPKGTPFYNAWEPFRQSLEQWLHAIPYYLR